MRDVAAWLVARPQNAIPVLGGAMLIPILQPISGAILVLLVLALGANRAAIQAGIATGIATLVWVLSGSPWQVVAVLIATTWVPPFLFAWGLTKTRSLVLTVQASVIIAMIAGLATGFLIDDAVSFWQPVIDAWLEALGRSGMAEGDNSVFMSPEFADNLGAIFVAGAWLSYVLLLLLGYRLYGQLETASGNFGRIRDLNLGRVLASCLVLMILLSAVTGSNLFNLVAIVLFATFLLQAWTLMYWMFAAKKLPMAGFYVLCFVSVVIGYVSAFLMVVGYLDAWFDLRRRVKNT